MPTVLWWHSNSVVVRYTVGPGTKILITIYYNNNINNRFIVYNRIICTLILNITRKRLITTSPRICIALFFVRANEIRLLRRLFYHNIPVMAVVCSGWWRRPRRSDGGARGRDQNYYYCITNSYSNISFIH